MKLQIDVSQFVRDLWNFIENVTDEDCERTNKFFALRERVREFYLFEQDADSHGQSKPSRDENPH